MDTKDHQHWAKIILALLIQHVRSYQGGTKYLTYGEVAKSVGYPEPYTGNLFSKNIGDTLGVMGHMFDDIIIRSDSVPMIQALVVAHNTKLPSDGLKEFYPTYPGLSPEKKRDLAKTEYQKIFRFGDNWDLLAEDLRIQIEGSNEKTRVSVKNLRNPFGSEGSPEHREIRDFIAHHPEAIGLSHPTNSYTEYPLKSGDCVDVVLEYEDRIVAVEVKSRRSGTDDLERGLYQCIKYDAVLKAEVLIYGSPKTVDCFLVVEGELSKPLIKVQRSLGLTVYSNISPTGRPEL